VHLVHSIFLLATLATAVGVAREWRSTAHAGAPVQARFLTGVATASATLSALTIAAMWLPVWMIPACIA